MIIDEIKNSFNPKPYTHIEEQVNNSEFHASLTTPDNTKYTLIVTSVDNISNIQWYVGKLKSTLKSYYNANFFKGVGLLLIVLGDKGKWSDMVNKVYPDWHGLQSVIVQGILFIDEKQRLHQFSRSKWGPIKFGNIFGQMDKIKILLTNLEAGPTVA